MKKSILSKLRAWLKRWLAGEPPRCDRCGLPLSVEDIGQRRTRHLGCYTTFDP